MPGFGDELDKWTTTHRVATPAVERKQPHESEAVREKVERRMREIDALTREQRLVVHEYGWNLIKTFIEHGITKPRTWRALINAVVHNAVDRKDRPPQG